MLLCGGNRYFEAGARHKKKRYQKYAVECQAYVLGKQYVHFGERNFSNAEGK